MTFNFIVPEGETLTLREAIGQAIGAASVSWKEFKSDAEFDEERAREIQDALLAFVGNLAMHATPIASGLQEEIRQMREVLGDAVMAHPDYDEGSQGNLLVEVAAAELLRLPISYRQRLTEARDALAEAMRKADPERFEDGFGTEYVEATAARFITMQAAEIASLKVDGARLKKHLNEEQARLRDHIARTRDIINAVLCEMFPNEFTPAMLETGHETTGGRVVRKLRELKKEAEGFAAGLSLVQGQINNIEIALNGDDAMLEDVQEGHPYWCPALDRVRYLIAEKQDHRRARVIEQALEDKEMLSAERIEQLRDFLDAEFPKFERHEHPVATAVALLRIAKEIPKLAIDLFNKSYGPVISHLVSTGLFEQAVESATGIAVESEDNPDEPKEAASWTEVARNG